MSRLAVVVVMVSVSACLKAWQPEGTYACAPDGTCPAGFFCDTPFDAGAICCNHDTVRCLTLRAADQTCAEGQTSAVYFRDRDGDGFGNPNEQDLRCGRPAGFAERGAKEDCDDSKPEVNPLTPEQCNGVDDNCDGDLDERLMPREGYSRDEDGDGYPQQGSVVLACAAPPGTVRSSLPADCAPFEAARRPGVGERCNGIDDDCDGLITAASYVDTQTVNEPVRFPCVVPNTAGVCEAGVLTCAAGVAPACTSLRRPGPEVCDGLDTDCDGTLDNQPGCGGPPSLVGQPSLRYGGGVVAGGTGLFNRCQKNRVTAAGTNVGGRLTGVRTATSDGYLVWWAEATSDAGWDLSAPDVRLGLAWTATGTNPVAGRGLWGQAGDSSDGVFPAVYLCGDADDELVRFRWDQASTAFKQTETAFSGQLHLDPTQPDGGFVLGLGSGFDTRRVRRVEVMVRFLGRDYDFNMTAPTGFVK